MGGSTVQDCERTVPRLFLGRGNGATEKDIDDANARSRRTHTHTHTNAPFARERSVCSYSRRSDMCLLAGVGDVPCVGVGAHEVGFRGGHPRRLHDDGRHSGPGEDRMTCRATDVMEQGLFLCLLPSLPSFRRP